MYFRHEVYSEPIYTVNAEVVGVHKTRESAKEIAREFFCQALELKDNGMSGNGKYFSSEGGSTGEWDEEVFVQEEDIQ